MSMQLKKILAIAAILASSIPLTANAASVIDQSVFNHSTVISDISNGRGSGQTFTAGGSGLLSAVDVRITTQDTLFGHINFYLTTVGPGNYGFIDANSAHVEIDASVIPEGGYVNDPTPSSLIHVDTSALNFNVEAGEQYAFFAIGVFASNDVRALLELGCLGNSGPDQCGSPGTSSSYGGGLFFSGYASDSSPSNFQYERYADEVMDANFQTYLGPAAQVPVPATTWLFVSALLGLGTLRRRK